VPHLALLRQVARPALSAALLLPHLWQIFRRIVRLKKRVPHRRNVPALILSPCALNSLTAAYRSYHPAQEMLLIRNTLAYMHFDSSLVSHYLEP